MAGVFIKISGAMAAWALGLALIAAQQARAEGPEAQPPQLNRTDLAPAAVQQADALIEKYVQPIAAPEPTPQQQRAIESAMKLLKSEQATKGQIAIERFLQIGPAALGELRRLAATAPPENATGETPAADPYPATMATIIIRRIETAQRQPIVQELISLDEAARAVLSLKLDENGAAAITLKSRIEAATAALIRASANTTVDAPAVAGERKALAEAQAEEKQVRARRDMLMELRRLLTPKPPVQPAAPPEGQPQPATTSADVLQIQPISPPTGSLYGLPDMWPYGQDWWPVNGGAIPPPPFIYLPPVITFSPQTTNPPYVPYNPPFVPSNPPFRPRFVPFNPTPPPKQ